MNNVLLKSYLRCKRKAWLDLRGNKSYKTWSPHVSIQLITQIKNFRQLTSGELKSGVKACEEGSKGVLDVKIKSKFKKDIYIEVYPQLLLRTEGKSKWGEYKYIPVVSKLGRRTTKEHILDLAFCSVLLEKLEQTNIEKGLVVSSFKNKLEYETIFLKKGLKEKAIKILSELNNSLEGEIPDITENRKKCSICNWQKFCDKEAKLNGYLTDIDGIGAKTAKLFNKIGIINVNQLASHNKFDLYLHQEIIVPFS